MAIDTLTPFPAPPLLGQDQSTFNTNASNTLSGMQQFVDEQNISIGQMNTAFDSVSASEIVVTDAEAVAVAARDEAVAAVAVIPSGSINDTITTLTDVWSSSKVNTELLLQETIIANDAKLLLKASLTGATFTGQVKGITPVAAEDLARKDYVDAEISDLAISVGKVLQVVNIQDGEYAAGALTIPEDDTIPQITEGNEFMTLSITPKVATSALEIEVNMQVAYGGSTTPMVVALFKNGTSDALACVSNRIGVANYPMSFSFSHVIPAGDTSLQTFSVRAAPASGTSYFNGWSGVRRFGGAMASSIVIRETGA